MKKVNPQHVIVAGRNDFSALVNNINVVVFQLGIVGERYAGGQNVKQKDTDALIGFRVLNASGQRIDILTAFGRRKIDIGRDPDGLPLCPDDIGIPQLGLIFRKRIRL